MKFVLYTSILNQEDYDIFVVPKIIKTARSQNSIHQITGVLLFDGLNFTQYFEGEAQAVDRLSENILRDERHKNMAIILTGRHHTRLYSEWKMGYIDTTDHMDEAHSTPKSTLNMESFKKIVDRLQVQ